MSVDNNEEPRERDARERLNIDDSSCLETYANFFSVTGSPEDIMLDFGLMQRDRRNTAKIRARIYLNYYNAKRLLGGLGQSIRKYEETYGPLELDPRRRAANK
jgi:hypothetical protein